MEEIHIDWNPILWVGGIFMAIITGLLTWIALLTRHDRSTITVRLDKYEAWILEQQKELNELSKSTHTAIELIKQEQKQGQERLRIFREEFFTLSKKQRK